MQGPLGGPLIILVSPAGLVLYSPRCSGCPGCLHPCFPYVLHITHHAQGPNVWDENARDGNSCDKMMLGQCFLLALKFGYPIVRVFLSDNSMYSSRDDGMHKHTS